MNNKHKGFIKIIIGTGILFLAFASVLINSTLLATFSFVGAFVFIPLGFYDLFNKEEKQSAEKEQSAEQQQPAKQQSQLTEQPMLTEQPQSEEPLKLEEATPLEEPSQPVDLPQPEEPSQADEVKESSNKTAKHVIISVALYLFVYAISEIVALALIGADVSRALKLMLTTPPMMFAGNLLPSFLGYLAFDFYHKTISDKLENATVKMYTMISVAAIEIIGMFFFTRL